MNEICIKFQSRSKPSKAHLRRFWQQIQRVRHRLVLHLIMRQCFSHFETPQLQLRVDVLHDELDGDFILATAWNYDISMHHGRCDVVGVRRLHHCGILLQHAFQVAAALRDVSSR